MDHYYHYRQIDDVDDVNATDKVYQSQRTDRLVKVRAVRVPNPPGAGFGVVVVELSGAACSSYGKALKHGDGWQIAPAHRVTFNSDTALDFEAVLEAERLKVCAATERAAQLEEAAALLPR